MRLYWSLSAPLLALSASSGVVVAFAPAPPARDHHAAAVVNSPPHRANSALRQVVAAAGPDVKARQDISLEKLKAKDAASHAITKDVSVAMFRLGALFGGIRGGGGLGGAAQLPRRERPGTPNPYRPLINFAIFFRFLFFFRTSTWCSKTPT